jgi:hypothetical protein
MYALDHLGLPQGFQPSRASALKLAQTLDADSIVVGSYTTDGSGIVAEATLVDVPNLRMLPAVSVRGEMRDMMGVFGAAGVEADAGQLDPTVQRGRGDVCRGGKKIRLDAFEQYIRGITEPDQAERQTAPGKGGEAEPGLRTGVDGAGPRRLQPTAVCRRRPRPLRKSITTALTGSRQDFTAGCR